MRPHPLVHIGACGVQVGAAFWQAMSAGCGLRPDGSLSPGAPAPAGVFFQAASGGRHQPRALFLDTDVAALSALRATALGGLFRPDNLLFRNSGGTGGSHAAGRGYTSLRDQAIEALLHDLPVDDPSPTVLLMLGLAGGTGGGLGASFAETLREQRPKASLAAIAVTAGRGATPREVANEVLALTALHNVCDAVVLLDNDALGRASRVAPRVLQHAHRNAVAAQALRLLTSSAAHPGAGGPDLRELWHLLSPITGAHLFGLSVHGLPRADDSDVLGALCAPSNRLSGYEIDRARVLAAAFLGDGATLPAASALRRDRRLPWCRWSAPVVRRAAVPQHTGEALMVEAHEGATELLKRWLESLDALRGRSPFQPAEAADEAGLLRARRSLRALIDLLHTTAAKETS
jgi:hypothetical protein